jgi:hypothetical protein
MRARAVIRIANNAISMWCAARCLVARDFDNPYWDDETGARSGYVVSMRARVGYTAASET